MKLKKISEIKNYKSFVDFNWNNLLEGKSHAATHDFHDKVNIFFGENGSGKSSICDILKSVSQQKTFDYRYQPDNAILQFDDSKYNLIKGQWDKSKNKEDIIFFDQRFIDQNIHLGQERGTSANEQEQKSGKIIIEFDGEAIRLNNERNRLSDDANKLNRQKHDLDANYHRKHSSAITSQDEYLYGQYKDSDIINLKENSERLSAEKTEADKQFKSDNDLLAKCNNIQKLVIAVTIYNWDISIQSMEEHQSVVSRDIKTTAKIDAGQDLANKLLEHQSFFQQGIDILENNSTQNPTCPFCQSQNVTEDISKIVVAFKQQFDKTYEEHLKQFLADKETLVQELQTIIDRIKSSERYLEASFVTLEGYQNQYGISKLYSQDDRIKFLNQKPTTKNIEHLKGYLEQISMPSNQDISKLYPDAYNEYQRAVQYFDNISGYINAKNIIIAEFKKTNTQSSISKRIAETGHKLSLLTEEINFINHNKINDIFEIKNIGIKLEQAKIKHKAAQELYTEYCSNTAFKNQINKMQEYLEKFNLDFKLQLFSNKMRNKTEYPFSFKVTDINGYERDLKEGLSNGETQVLALCFFFALLDIQNIDAKEKRILVFDDPITSLDNRYLNALTKLIELKRDEFSQLFIFTHHMAFFKYLISRFLAHKSSGGKGNQYNIMRNGNGTGGSFICKSKGKDIIDKLQKFVNGDSTAQASNTEEVSYESLSIEYGQYLRYEIESFIKNDMLCWDNYSNFPIVIDGIKTNNKLNDKDLDQIKKIYSFCNNTTAHVILGEEVSIDSLKDQIKTFLELVGRYNKLKGDVLSQNPQSA